MTPNTGPFDGNVVASACSKLVDRIGESILVTHSQGGGPGWMTAIKNERVKAVIAYEPFSGFIFPKGNISASIQSASLFSELKGVEIPLSEFEKLTKIPIGV